MTTSFVSAGYPVQPSDANRTGAPESLFDAMRKKYQDWNERRLRDRHDDQFWQAALQDARIMADISRAMNAAAMRDVKTYY